MSYDYASLYSSLRSPSLTPGADDRLTVITNKLSHDPEVQRLIRESTDQVAHQVFDQPVNGGFVPGPSIFDTPVNGGFVPGPSLEERMALEGQFMPGASVEQPEPPVADLEAPPAPALAVEDRVIPAEAPAPVNVPAPVEDIAGDTHAVAEKAIGSAAEGQVAQAAPTSLASKVKPVQDPSKWLASIPIVAALLYNSKERYLRNVKIEITSTDVPKNYSVVLRKGRRSRTIEFQVQAGQPIRFLNGRTASAVSTKLPCPLFKSTMAFAMDWFGPLKHFIWRREEILTYVTVNVNDRSAPALKKAPEVVSMPLSELEAMQFIRRHPDADNAFAGVDRVATPTETARYASFKMDTLDLRSSVTARVRIPLLNPGQTSSDEDVLVTQEYA